MTITMRKYPFPYKSMLAICSDLDETPNKEVYFEIMKYLNTSDQTVLGKGVDLEVGNTIYFDMPKDQFSYTNTDQVGQREIHKLIDSGHIDCLHSFGDFTTSREKIEFYWNKIQSGNRKLEVWIDHAQAITNFDSDIMKGAGAYISHQAYHADLSVDSGVLQFIWKGRVTSVIAQNVSKKYLNIINPQYLLPSLKTIFKELAKTALAALGNKKYEMHLKNEVMRKTELINGSPITEFMRSNPAYRGVSVFDNARSIHNVLTEHVLSELVKNSGCSIFYTHLGKINTVDEPFLPQTKEAFERLARYSNHHEILVTTTRKLLGYDRSTKHCTFFVSQEKHTQNIYLTTEFCLEDLQGLTWYVDNPKATRLFINGKHVENCQLNPEDHTGRKSISIPWRPLIFPTLSYHNHGDSICEV